MQKVLIIAACCCCLSSIFFSRITALNEVYPLAVNDRYTVVKVNASKLANKLPRVGSLFPTH